MNVSRLLNLAAIVSLDLEYQCNSYFVILLLSQSTAKSAVSLESFFMDLQQMSKLSLPVSLFDTH